MVIFKKLIFAFPFLIAFIAFCLQLKSFLAEPTLVLALDFKIFQQEALIGLSAMFIGIFFVLFATLAQEWKFVFTIVPAISLTSILFLSPSTSFFFAILCFFIFNFVYVLLKSKLNTYLTFTANTLLKPYITETVTFLLIASSVIFYVSSDKNIKQNGFKPPPSLIKIVSQFMSTAMQPNSQSISPKNFDELKKTPELLKQFGLNKEILDQLTKSQTQSSSQSLQEANIDNQIQTLIKPYLSFIPLIVTIIFFLNLVSVAWVLSLFLDPILWFIFWLLDKLKFTSYAVETRQVKKLVV